MVHVFGSLERSKKAGVRKVGLDLHEKRKTTTNGDKTRSIYPWYYEKQQKRLDAARKGEEKVYFRGRRVRE